MKEQFIKLSHAAALALVFSVSGCAATTPTCEQLWGLTCNEVSEQWNSASKLANEENRQISENAKENGCEVLVKQVALDVALRRSLGEAQSAVLQHYRAEFLTGKMPMPSAMQDAAFDTNSRIIADVYALPEPLKSDAVDSYAANVERLCEQDDAAYNPSHRLSANLKAARGSE